MAAKLDTAIAGASAASAGAHKGKATWVSCDLCGKWRRLGKMATAAVPDAWTCVENPDSGFASCNAPQELSNDEIDRQLGLADEPPRSRAPRALPEGPVRETRGAVKRSAPGSSASAPAAQRPAYRLRQQPRRKLYSIAFTWPAGREYLAAGAGRQSPAWYADRVTDFVSERAADGVTSILVNVHGALPAAALAALTARWKRAFALAANPRGDGRDDEDAEEELIVRACPRDAHAMLPVAMRCVPLIDDREERAVICADVHDSLSRQAGEIERLLEQMEADGGCTAGFTAWPGYDLRSSFRRDDSGLAPPPSLRVDRSAAEAREGIVWHLDCGLLLTTLAFRQKLRGLRAPSYAAHVKWCHGAYEYDGSKGTDEQMLEMFLLAGRPAGREGLEAQITGLVRQQATLRVHQLCADTSTAKKKAARLPASDQPKFERPPQYAHQKPRQLQFVFDDEVRCAARFANEDAKLSWEPI